MGEGSQFRIARRAVLAAAALAPAAAFAGAAGPIVRTRAGRVAGRSEQQALAFLGIPYAESTAGDNRFRPPQPVAAWDGIRDATGYGPICPQPVTARGPGARGPSTRSEDCLTVNVWTPAADAARRPVMVWFHGGALATGSGSSRETNGARLAARRDVVVVGVTHRINMFGYLYLDELGVESANVGQLDLVAALAWVRDNIASFGGDPDNVTVFGESGGGTKVAALLHMPSAAGLFHRAILQSGFGSLCQTRDDATRFARSLIARLGLPDAAALRSVPAGRLAQAWFELVRGNVAAGALLVPDGQVLPEAPLVAGIPALARRVPLLVGHTATETSALFPPPGVFEFDWDRVAAALAPRFRDPAGLIAGFRRLQPEASPSQIYFAITTAAVMGRNARNAADSRASMPGAAAYAYLLDWPTPVQGGRLGAPHALDVPLVFDTIDEMPELFGEGARAAQPVADAMGAAWTAFARTGSPNAPGLANWPAYTVDRRPVMVFDTESRAIDDPWAAAYALLAAHG